MSEALKYQTIRDALDDFPAFTWDDLFKTIIMDEIAFLKWKKDYAELMQAIQDGTVKYDN